MEDQRLKFSFQSSQLNLILQMRWVLGILFMNFPTKLNLLRWADSTTAWQHKITWEKSNAKRVYMFLGLTLIYKL